MEHLAVQGCIASKKNLKYLSELLTHWTLQTLDISHSRGITGKLSVLMSRDLRSLSSLILHNCELNERDMMSLAEANNKGTLSKLANLDLSENPDMIKHFGVISSIWESLKRLKINYQPDGFSLKHGKFETLPEGGYFARCASVWGSNPGVVS